MAESIPSLAALRRHIASLDRAPARDACVRFATGHGPLDAMLGGGLARGRVHEVFGAGGEEGAATGLALLWAQLAGGNAPLLWLRSDGAARIGGLPYGPGLAALGLDPARLLLGAMPDDAMLLRAGIDALPRLRALDARAIAADADAGTITDDDLAGLATGAGIQQVLTRRAGWLEPPIDTVLLPRFVITQPVANSPGRLFDWLLGNLNS